MNRSVFWALVVMYLVLSFVPQLGLMSLLGKTKAKG